MGTIYELLARAAALREETALNSISPERAGGIMYDTIMAINELWLQQGSALVISKIYSSVSAMEADDEPVSDITGQPLRAGQIVVIASSASDNGSVYRFGGISEGASVWALVGLIGNITPVDALDSDSTQLPLAAHQGKVLDGKISQLGQEVGDLFTEPTTDNYVNYDYVLRSGITYKVSNISDIDCLISVRARNAEGVTQTEVCNNLRVGESILYTPSITTPKVGVISNLSGGRVRIIENASLKSAVLDNTDDILELKKSQEKSEDSFSTIFLQETISLISQSTIVRNGYVSASGDLTDSGSWRSYKFDLSKTKILSVGAYSNSSSIYEVAFYSNLDTINSTTFLGGYKFANSGTAIQNINNIEVPNTAVCAIVSNRISTNESIIINGVAKDAIEGVIEYGHEDAYQNEKYLLGNFYIKGDGELVASGSWKAIMLEYGLFDFFLYKGYSNNLNFNCIAFYSGTPSASSFISGITFTSASLLVSEMITPASVPTGTKYIVLSSRIASSTDQSADVYYTVKNVIRENQKRIDRNDNEIGQIHGRFYESTIKGFPECKRVFKDVNNKNDFVFVRDELWLAVNIYDGGVATDETDIYRYKIVNDNLVLVGTLSTDFGHWNSVDYCEANDCLLFTNSANDFSTEGNYFCIVKNPLSLSGSVQKSDVGLIYYVDLGYKVNAVWGDANLGENNIIYALSNNSANLSKIMLGKDNNGDFNGEFVVLESIATEVSIGINGMAYWGGKIYIGAQDGESSTYKIGILDLSDLSFRLEKRKYYSSNGEAITGVVQGLFIDSEYIWVFTNISGIAKNHLVQYCK